MRTRVKICGITRPQDGVAASHLGADAIGLVFYDKSPRAVDREQACDITDALPPFITVVGLFVNAPRRFIEDMLVRVPVHLLQFHGDETAAECVCYGLPYLKAIMMRDEVVVSAVTAAHPRAAGFLLDAYSADAAGGTGRTFDWSRVPQGVNRPLILAGGLHAGNVATAIRAVRPYGVDVSSGVEQGRGIKDAAMIAAFLHEVESGDAS